MGERNVKAEQMKAEQRAIDEMYERLDADLKRTESAQKQALASPAEEPAELYARDIEVARLAESVRQLRSAEHSLCFGRIDHADDGGSLHIGRIGVRTEAGELLLVDWRAEAARPFYSATMASPMGVRRRRHLRLVGRRVRDVSDEILNGTPPRPGDVIGDGPLVAALGGARTGRMREAAATLQAEQDEIVRSAHRGITVVDGGPGTGKTIVALHRAAYVLYAFPTIAERGVLVFGPNRRFLAYISDVLPSLGENDVQLATTPDLVGAEPTRVDAESVARIKGRALFADALAHRVHAHEPHGVPLEVRTPHDTVVLEAPTVDAARRSALQGGIGHNPARALFAEYIVDELVTELERRSAKDESEFEDELQALLGIDLDRFTGREAQPGGGDVESSGGGLGIDWDVLRGELLDDPGVEEAIAGVWPQLQPDHVLRELLADRAALAETFPDLSERELDALAGGRPGWSDADLPLLDEVRALVDGPPDAVYGHIVVDEAQQLTEMQWRVLMRRCPGRSMTIVGDLAQAGPLTTIRTWAEALAPFVDERFAHHTLTVNYRTTAEILAESEALLARIAPAQRLSRSIRHGEPPRTLVAGVGEWTATLSDLIARTAHRNPGELIGVVTAASRAGELDAEAPRADVAIVAAPDARGLEFDTVIIVDPDAIRAVGEAGLRDLYVAQTRATKRLITLQLVPEVAMASAEAGR